MKDGLIQQIDTPLKLYNNPVNRFVAGFIGSPAMNFIEGKIVRDNGIFFIGKDEKVKLKIPENHIEKLENYVDEEITAGIRPENIHYNKSDSRITGQEVEVKLDVTEPMGNEIFLYFEISGSNMIARIPAVEEPEPGQRLKLYFDAAKMHFFDSKTEKNIYK